jgi:acyl-CoA reductase-like NAD-dependent aldehyde dehydrogenase
MNDQDRLAVLKTWKLFIKGSFPRSESGRTLPLNDSKGALLAHLSHASRKDLREAIEAARGAFPGWSGSTAYLRSQIIYRLAEMLEGRRAELLEGIRSTSGVSRKKADAEVSAAIDRTVSWAGWCDKFPMVLGSRNPVAGPYHNFSMPEASGVCVAIQGVANQHSLLGFLSLVLPPLCTGNTVVAIAHTAHPLGALLISEMAPTADIPPGALNIITGDASELVGWIASHRDVDSIHAIADDKVAAVLRAGSAENLKRVQILPADEDFADTDRWTNPRRLAAFVEIKTVWHPWAV